MVRRSVAVWGLLLCACDSGAESAPVIEAPSAEVEADAPDPVTGRVVLQDLLRTTRSRVTVSSRVDNDKDAPEHLVDGRADTAWNSRTGDLGAWVRFEVPAAARVKRVLLTAGFDRASKAGDAFLQNHRVSKVAVEREGKLVGVHDLDPNDRKPQAIELDEAGGAFEIRVLQTVPGTERRFREIAISELSVLGTVPDDALIADSTPDVEAEGEAALGRPTSFERLFAEAPYPTIEALCAKHLAISTPQVEAALKQDGADVFLSGVSPFCRAELPRRAPYLGAPYEVRILDGMEDVAFVSRLVVKTGAGWFPTDVVFERTYPGPGCGQSGGFEIEATGVEARGSAVRVDFIKRRGEWLHLDERNWEAAARTRVVCRPGAREVTCRSALIAATTADLDWRTESNDTGRWSLVPPRWLWTRDVTVEDTGSLRLGPCVDAAGDHVACALAAERWLAR